MVPVSTLFDKNNMTDIAITSEEAHQAQEISRRLNSDRATVFAISGDETSSAVRPELDAILRKVIQAMSEGGAVTIGSLPRELTTTVAAQMIGVSRPTLMKKIREGQLPSHKVGAHTRLKTEDVQEYIRKRQVDRAAAFAELRELEDSLEENEG